MQNVYIKVYYNPCGKSCTHKIQSTCDVYYVHCTIVKVQFQIPYSRLSVFTKNVHSIPYLLFCCGCEELEDWIEYLWIINLHRHWHWHCIFLVACFLEVRSMLVFFSFFCSCHWQCIRHCLCRTSLIML